MRFSHKVFVAAAAATVLAPLPAAVAAPGSGGGAAGSGSGASVSAATGSSEVPTAPASSATLILAYSFGNRMPAGADPDRTIGEPGPVNEELAAAVMAARGDRSTPVYAQTEIAQVLRTRYGLTDVVAIDPVRDADGKLIYLSTDGVAAKVAELRGGAAATDRVAVVAFQDHLWRATATTAKRGFTAFAPEGVTMPSTYDPQSGQLWTTSALLYLPTDLLGRLALLR